MNRIVICACLMPLAGACSQEMGGQLARSDAQSAPASVPQYASEAQRARALNYWLPENQLPADADVAADGS
jgi:hypothetical protein